MKRTQIGGWALSVLLASSVATAQTPNNEEQLCRADEPRLDKYGYLRSLYLDLLGTVPTPEDYAQLDDVDDLHDIHHLDDHDHRRHCGVARCLRPGLRDGDRTR